MKRLKVSVQSVKNPECKYELLKYDEGTQTATLMGRWGATFTLSPFSKERAAKEGYTLVKEEVEDAEPAGIQA